MAQWIDTSPVTMGIENEEIASLHKDVREELNLQSERRDLPCLTMDDVCIQSQLGSGSFSEVYSVSILLDSWLDGTIEDNRPATKPKKSSDEIQKCLRPRSRHSWFRSMSSMSLAPPKYALKTIRHDFEDDSSIMHMAVKDSYFEAEILAHLPVHPNLINLVAVSTGYWENPAKGFLILEKATETLQYRLVRWRREFKSNKALVSSLFQPGKGRRGLMHAQRSRVESCGVGIARALKFLHQHGIIYRDLKPANIGFGFYDGQIKLFDFGLARTQRLSDQTSRKLTGNVGTARYMAPEVTLHADYCLPADVFSYAVLLWEILTLEKPFEGIKDLKQLQNMTVHRHKRPSLRKISSPLVKDLLRACWDRDPSARPTSVLIVKQVELAAKAEEQ